MPVIETLKKFLFLPKQTSEFEEAYLRQIHRIAMAFFVWHVPLFTLFAWFHGTGPIEAFLLTSMGLIGPVVALATLQSRRAISIVMGITMVYMCGLLTHFGQGPTQTEMHFYFFVGLSLLSVFGNPMVIIVATITIIGHHVGLYFILPQSAFQYGATPEVLVTHVAFACCGAAAAVFIGRTFFDNVIGMEQLVSDRTTEVESRNDDMRMILTSVSEGFLTIGPDLRVGMEKSSVVDDLLGQVHPGELFPEIIARHDAKTADWLEFGLMEVFESMMPPEVSIDQLPSRIVAGNRHLSLEFAPVQKEGQLKFLTVLVRDITAEVERSKLEAETRQILTIIEQMCKDRNGFLEFMHESSIIMDEVRGEVRNDLSRLRRRLHTLKGNAAIFGLYQLADACHAVEEQLLETPEVREGRVWTRMFSCWSQMRANLRRIASLETRKIQLSVEQYNEMLVSLLEHTPHDELAHKLAGWHLDPTENRLKTLAKKAKRLARRLGKGNIQVRVSSNGLCTEASTWGPFWNAMIHVVNNSVDHGLERIEDRRKAGKSDYGCIRLKTYCEQGKFIVSVSDDGRGIDWEHIAQLAEKRGLPRKKYTDLVNALFVDGLSSKKEATAVSGRGVGMATIQQICNELDGLIEITSEPGKGTEIQFVFPINQMAPDTYQLFNNYGINADVPNLASTCHP